MCQKGVLPSRPVLVSQPAATSLLVEETIFHLCQKMNPDSTLTLPIDCKCHKDVKIQGGSNMTGTVTGLFRHKSVLFIFEPPCIS